MTNRATPRRLVAAVAVAVVAIAVWQPWYALVTRPDLESVGLPSGAGGYEFLYATGRAAPTANTWISGTLKGALLITAACVLAGSLPRHRRPRLLLLGSAAALAIATGMSVYVLAADDAIWWSGLWWLWGAALTLMILAGLDRYWATDTAAGP